jgi:hypothetical protein
MNNYMWVVYNNFSNVFGTMKKWMSYYIYVCNVKNYLNVNIYEIDFNFSKIKLLNKN